MVDIHSHILWGLDDGAESQAQSVAMLQMAAQAGTTDIVATPHANYRYTFDPILVGERIAQLSAGDLPRPTIHRGCDFHLSFDNIQDALERPTRYAINGGPYMLVEFPDTPLTGMKAALEALLQRGLVPIMTHPERQPFLRQLPDDFKEWVDMGCLVQVTAQSLLGRFGKRSEESAWEMVRRGLVHFVASDAHDENDRVPRLDLAFEAVVARASREAAENFFVNNPRAVITGGTVVREQAPKRPSRFRFWK